MSSAMETWKWPISPETMTTSAPPEISGKQWNDGGVDVPVQGQAEHLQDQFIPPLESAGIMGRSAPWRRFWALSRS